MDVPPTFLLGGLAGFTGVGNRGFLRHPWCKGFFASLLFPSFVNPQLFSFFLFFFFGISGRRKTPVFGVCAGDGMGSSAAGTWLGLGWVGGGVALGGGEGFR